MSKYPTSALQGASPADLVWLQGQWRGQHEADTVEEHWTGLGANTLLGMFRWEHEGAVRFYEIIAIEAQDEHVRLRIKHLNSGEGLKTWETQEIATEFILVQQSEHKAVFLQLKTPKPNWMIYHLEDENTLLAYFESEDETPERSEMFVYKRL